MAGNKRGGLREPDYVKVEKCGIYLPLPQDLHAFMRAHSFRRDVSEQTLIRDVMTCWVRRATPLNDPIFQVYSIGYHLPPPVADAKYYEGYVASLRFLPEADWKVPDGDEPPPRTKSELWPEQKPLE